METSKKKNESESTSKKEQHWFLGANPLITRLSIIEEDKPTEYPMYSEKAPYHRRFNFRKAKVGDKVIGYEGEGTKKIKGEKAVVAILKIIKIEDDFIKKEGRIVFKVSKKLPPRVTPVTLKSYPELKGIYFRNRSLSKLTKEQYDFILGLI